MAADSYVYVIGTPGSSTVKIGRTTNLERRLADIQRMSPVPLEVLWSHPGGSELETQLHRHFKPIRSHGEWFQFEDEPVQLVRSAVADRPWAQVERSRPTRKPTGPGDLRREQLLLPVMVPSPSLSLGPLLDSMDAATAEVKDVSDLVERYRSAQELRQKISRVEDSFMAMQQSAVTEMKASRTWAEVGALIGLSGARAHQLSKPRTPHERN